MIKKIFLFAPNKIDVYTVGVSGVIKIDVFEDEVNRSVYIYFENNLKVYCGMPCIYDAEHNVNPYGKRTPATVTE